MTGAWFIPEPRGFGQHVGSARPINASLFGDCADRLQCYGQRCEIHLRQGTHVVDRLAHMLDRRRVFCEPCVNGVRGWRTRFAQHLKTELALQVIDVVAKRATSDALPMTFNPKGLDLLSYPIE